MINQFLDEIHKYKSINSFQKLKIIAPKYLNNNIKYIQVTGTNGKGSVSRFIHAILWRTAFIKRVGLFTSPHINAINERIIINDKMISDADLIRIKAIISDDINTYQLGFFAILTLIALIYFQEQKVQWVILEVGIGGAFDTTNIIDATYAVITSIGKDHQDMLGYTKTAILKQKLGIIKATTKAIFISGNLSKRLRHYIKLQNYEVIYAKKLWQKPYYEENKELAITVIKSAFPMIDEKQITTIINATTIRFRFEQYKIANKTIYFDAAHNVDGMKALVKTLRLNNIKPQQIIFSCLKNKYPKKLLKVLKTVNNNILICQNSNNLSIAGQTFNWDKMIKQSPNNIILVTGSCYFLADVYNYLRKDHILITK